MRSRAIAGALLTLPFAALFTLLVLHIEPPLGPLAPLFHVGPDQPQVLGSLIVLGAWLLSVAAMVLNSVPLVRQSRAGLPVTGLPANLAVALFALLLVGTFVGAIVIDQYPCWTGVPNCD